MTIRPETPGDVAAIEKIHLAAFASHPYSRQTEHLIVNALRDGGALTISLVAELNGEVAGHVAFSPATLDGQPCPWYVLGPIGVLPARQRRGIGQALVREGLDALRRAGAEGCVLVGDPAYYSRFGFAPDAALVLAGVPPQYFLCLPFTGQVPRGSIGHHAAFTVSARTP